MLGYTKELNCRKNKGMVLSIFLVLFVFAHQSMADSKSGLSVWDTALPAMQLNNVAVNAASFEDAWKHISTDFLLRSVLVVSDNTSTNIPFSFKAAQCSGVELLNALIASYPDFTWEQNNETGVIWIHPKDLAMVDILSSKIRIAVEQLGVPMQSGILEVIEGLPNIGITVKRWGTLFNNTFNYPVDLQTGEYTLRDLLNICCIANPTKTFYIRVSNGNTSISAVNLVSDKLTVPPQGALLFWTLEIGKLSGQVPTKNEIIDGLDNVDARIRQAARMYMEATIWNCSFDELITKCQSREQRLWVCLGTIDVLVRSEEATHIAAIEKMQAITSKDFFEKGDPNLAVLVAVELARLGNDTTALNIVSQRKFSLGTLAHIKSKIDYSARMSSKVRDALQVTGTNWLSTSEPSLKGLDKATLKATFVESN